MVDCGVHQIDLARWWLGSEVVRQSAFGAWVDEYEAPDHVHLHMDHACGAHTHVEMSFSFGHTVAEPAPQFEYDIIGAEGFIRYHAEQRVFELRTVGGTTRLEWSEQKNFAGMYAAFAQALQTGHAGDLATGRDGLIAMRIARSATNQAIRRRSESRTGVPPVAPLHHQRAARLHGRH